MTTSTAPGSPSPLVSVIVPVYNAMPHLTATLESICAQDLRDFELICVDDGSMDGSGATLDEFAARDSRIVVIHQAGSGWAGAPRNRGLERATGTFVFFSDNDDTLAPGALRTMVDLAEKPQPGKPPVDIVIPGVKGVGGRRVPPLFLRHPRGDVDLGRAMESLTVHKLFRRELIERLGLRFPEGEVRLEDGIFVTRAYVHARRIAYCAGGPLYFFLRRSDRGNASSRRFHPRDYVNSCRAIAETLLTGVPDEDRANELVSEFFVRQGLRFYLSKRWRLTSPLRRRNWMSEHRRFLQDLVPEHLDDRVADPTQRHKLALIRAGDRSGMNALVAAERRLDHTSHHIGAEVTGDSLTLTLDITPRGRRTRLSDSSEVHLYLAGYRVLAGAVVPGRLAHSGDGAILRFRFVLPPEILERYRGDRVALWTIAGTGDGLSGNRVRVTALAPVEEDTRDARVFTTSKLGLSLDLRSGRRSPAQYR